MFHSHDSDDDEEKYDNLPDTQTLLAALTRNHNNNNDVDNTMSNNNIHISSKAKANRRRRNYLENNITIKAEISSYKGKSQKLRQTDKINLETVNIKSNNDTKIIPLDSSNNTKNDYLYYNNTDNLKVPIVEIQKPSFSSYLRFNRNRGNFILNEIVRNNDSINSSGKINSDSLTETVSAAELEIIAETNFTNKQDSDTTVVNQIQTKSVENEKIQLLTEICDSRQVITSTNTRDTEKKNYFVQLGRPITTDDYFNFAEQRVDTYLSKKFAQSLPALSLKLLTRNIEYSDVRAHLISTKKHV